MSAGTKSIIRGHNDLFNMTKGNLQISNFTNEL
jgi:hypothetical protein